MGLWVVSGAAIFFILSSESCSSATRRNSPYIGYEGREPPKELHSMGGWVIGESEFSVGEVTEKKCTARPCAKGTKQMLWLEKTIRRDKKGRAITRVKDVVYLPSGYEKNFTFQLMSSCMFKGQDDPAVTALAEFEPNKPVLKNIKKAWRADLKKGKFVKLKAKDVSCHNPGYGYSG